MVLVPPKQTRPSTSRPWPDGWSSWAAWGLLVLATGVVAFLVMLVSSADEPIDRLTGRVTSPLTKGANHTALSGGFDLPVSGTAREGEAPSPLVPGSDEAQLVVDLDQRIAHLVEQLRATHGTTGSRWAEMAERERLVTERAEPDSDRTNLAMLQAWVKQDAEVHPNPGETKLADYIDSESLPDLAALWLGLGQSVGCMRDDWILERLVTWERRYVEDHAQVGPESEWPSLAALGSLHLHLLAESPRVSPAGTNAAVEAMIGFLESPAMLHKDPYLPGFSISPFVEDWTFWENMEGERRGLNRLLSGARNRADVILSIVGRWLARPDLHLAEGTPARTSAVAEEVLNLLRELEEQLGPEALDAIFVGREAELCRGLPEPVRRQLFAYLRVPSIDRATAAIAANSTGMESLADRLAVFEARLYADMVELDAMVQYATGPDVEGSPFAIVAIQAISRFISPGLRAGQPGGRLRLQAGERTLGGTVYDELTLSTAALDALVGVALGEEFDSERRIGAIQALDRAFPAFDEFGYYGTDHFRFFSKLLTDPNPRVQESAALVLANKNVRPEWNPSMSPDFFLSKFQDHSLSQPIRQIMADRHWQLAHAIPLVIAKRGLATASGDSLEAAREQLQVERDRAQQFLIEVRGELGLFDVLSDAEIDDRLQGVHSPSGLFAPMD